MKKFYLLSALLLILVGCGPVRYQYRGSYHANSHVQERLDRRSYRLRIEQEIHKPRGNASRYGRGIVDIPDFIIAVNGDRLHYMRSAHNEYRIANYRDTRNSQRRNIRFSSYNRYGNSLEGKYELSVYPDGRFRLLVLDRYNSVRHEYEGQMELGYDHPGPRYSRR